MFCKRFKSENNENIFEPKQSFSNMKREKYGYIGRGLMPYSYNYQNLNFTGTGKIFCRCEDVTELNFDISCMKKSDFLCEKTEENVIIFIVDGAVIYSSRNNPKEINVYYDDSLICKKSTFRLVDH